MTTDPDPDLTLDIDPRSPDDRRREAARILARGLLRLLSVPEKSLENRETPLEVLPETSLTVHTG